MINKSPTGFQDSELLAWEPEAGIDGLYSKTLTRCAETGSYTRLLKFVPGTNTTSAGVQAHDHLEELLVIEGAIFDLTLEQNFTAGMYANRLAGMDHGPWVAPAGAVTLELRDNDPDHRITKQQFEFFDPGIRDWDGRDDAAGVFVKTLTSCPNTSSFGRLVNFQPGAGAPGQLEGDAGRSELWVVEGVLHHKDGTVHPQGTYGNLDVDLLDGSWTSDIGCTVFEVRNLV